MDRFWIREGGLADRSAALVAFSDAGMLRSGPQEEAGLGWVIAQRSGEMVAMGQSILSPGRKVEINEAELCAACQAVIIMVVLRTGRQLPAREPFTEQEIDIAQGLISVR